MIDAIEIILDHPVEFAGETHSVITVRPPSADDVRRVSARNHNPFARGVALAAMVTGCRPAMILKLNRVDSQKIDAFLTAYMC